MQGNFRSILSMLDKTTLLSIIIISSIINLLMLVVPVTIQTLVNIVAFGKMLRPIATLGLIVLILMLAIAFLNVWQSIIIETIRQKFVVKVSFELTDFFSHMVLNTRFTKNHPDLVNRFFEIFTITKALASILLNGTNLCLQTIFGLTLLAIYHPAFLLFDAFVLGSLAFIILWPYKLALVKAKEECSEKHNIAIWLEELFAHKNLFNFLTYEKFAKKQTDKRLFNFLKTRNVEFRQLIKHQTGLYILAAISMSLLLCVGGYLVTQNQLSLGQLVAAEIIFSVLIYGFKDIFNLLESYYELKASLNKIRDLANFQTEATPERETENLFLDIQTVQFNLDHHPPNIASKTQPLLIELMKREDSTSFTKQMFGFEPLSSLSIHINGIACNTAFLKSLREDSLLIDETQWFIGTIYENLTLDKRQLSNKRIYECLELLNLHGKIMQLPEGLHTPLNSLGSLFTLSDIAKIIIARAWLAEPQILVFDCILDLFEKEEGQQILSILLSELKNTVLVVMTQTDYLNQIQNRWVLT